MAALQEYKCPCCGGAIEFNTTAQKMKCPFCDTEFEMETLQSFDDTLKEDGADEMDWKTNAGTEWSEGETDGLRSYVCKSCGGEIVGDENTAATSCPYCGNPIVMMGQFSGSLKPDYVIPFKLDKKEAKEKLAKHFSGKKLLPDDFTKNNHLDDVKGVYVPYWLFDADSQGRFRYKATKVENWSDSKYNYTRTDYFNVIRGGIVGFDNVPVDGSSKMDDTLMESLEPFNFEDAVTFQTAYLAGYVADKYDVDADSSVARANERVKQSTSNMFRETVQGYRSVTEESATIKLRNGIAKYALYPVWILNTTWKDNQYIFAMNGQTGKFVGDLPADKGKATKKFFSAFGIGTVIMFAIMFLFSLMSGSEEAGFDPVSSIVIALIVGLVIGFIYRGILMGQLKSVYRQETASDYTRKGSFKLQEQSDAFLYSETKKVEKPQNQQSNSKA